ncbi:MAG: four helix bundle protein [Planctomycetes bacterium]|nr:four helix bundle protein [Planctomycetota bacterium]
MSLRNPAKSFEDLIVWQKAHALVLSAYRLTKAFPDDERYGLVPQLRRSVISVPANIAEGFKRRTRADKARSLNIAQAPLEEVRYFFILCRDLGYAFDKNLFPQLEEVSKLLEAYYKAVLNSGL